MTPEERFEKIETSLLKLETNLDMVVGQISILGNRIDDLTEAQQKTDDTVKTLAGATAQLTDLVGTLLNAQQNTQTNVNSLAVHLVQLTEKVDALTDIIERHVTEGHGNGKKS